MSGENLEIVRRAYDAFARRDWDAFFRDMSPDFEMTTKRGPNAGTREGRASVQEFGEDYLSGFDSSTIEPDEFLDAGELIVVLVTRRSRPKGGSADIVVRNGHLWTLRAGTIMSLESFPDPKKALEAAGLSE